MIRANSVLTTISVICKRKTIKNMAQKKNKSYETGTIRVNDVNIYYEKNGRGPHAVLLLPGLLGCCATDFQPQLQKLNTEQFTVLCLDPRGYGNSRPPDRDYPMDLHHRDAKDARDVMLAKGFEKFSLMGWSGGGITALILAATYQDNINKMVVWGAISHITDDNLKMWKDLRNVNKWSERMKLAMFEIYGREYSARCWSKNVDFCIEIVEKFGGNICMNELEHIIAPTLIIHGRKDVIASLYHGKYLKENIRNSVLEIWDEGRHDLHLRFPDKFNARVEKFLLGESKL